MTNDRLHESSEALVERQIEIALEQTRAAANKRQCDDHSFAEWDGETCFDCSMELPQVRLQYGFVRCVSCQTKVENRRR